MDCFHEVDDPPLTSPNHIGQSTISNTSTNSQNNEKFPSNILRNETSATSCLHGPEGDEVASTQDQLGELSTMTKLMSTHLLMIIT